MNSQSHLSKGSFPDQLYKLVIVESCLRDFIVLLYIHLYKFDDFISFTDYTFIQSYFEFIIIIIILRILLLLTRLILLFLFIFIISAPCLLGFNWWKVLPLNFRLSWLLIISILFIDLLISLISYFRFILLLLLDECIITTSSLVEQVLLLRLDCVLVLMRVSRINVIIVGGVLHVLCGVHSLIVVAYWGNAEVVHICVYHQLDGWNLLLLLVSILSFKLLLIAALILILLLFLKQFTIILLLLRNSIWLRVMSLLKCAHPSWKINILSSIHILLLRNSSSIRIGTSLWELC